MALTRLDRDQDCSRFPTGLLSAGYATGAVGAIAVALQGGGLLAAGLAFWLGGALATVLWGAVGMLLCRHAPDKDSSDAEYLRRGGATASAK